MVVHFAGVEPRVEVANSPGGDGEHTGTALVADFQHCEVPCGDRSRDGVGVADPGRRNLAVDRVDRPTHLGRDLATRVFLAREHCEPRDQLVDNSEVVRYHERRQRLAPGLPAVFERVLSGEPAPPLSAQAGGAALQVEIRTEGRAVDIPAPAVDGGDDVHRDWIR